MKLFFASDIHGSLPATEKVIARFLSSGAEQLVLLGDILNHGPRNPIPEGYNPSLVAQRLNELAARIIAVRGNCDSEVDQMLLQFPMMMDYAWVLLESGQRLFLTHGHTYNQQAMPLLQAKDTLIHGHTHIPVAMQNDEGIHIFNPGSVTFPRQDYPASYGLFTDGELKVIDFDDNELMSVTLR